MALPDNFFQNVQTYQKSELAWMLNEFCAINISNKKFKDFNKLTANLGDSVTFDLAPRASTVNGLVVSEEQSVQRYQTLSCTQAANSSSAYNDQQFIFNAEEYMDRFGESRIMALGNKVEIDILQQIVSGVRVNDPALPNFGQIIDPTSGPYRFFGDAVTPIASYVQLAQFVANFKNYGAAQNKLCAILPDISIPQVIDNGSTKFAPVRNDEIVESWKLGRFANCEWYTSNLLPIHISGTVGDNQTTGANILTLTNVNDPSGNNITQLTFSGAGTSDVNAIKNGDVFQFVDGVTGKPNMRFLTFQGYYPSSQPVQFRATADAVSDGSGNVVINIFPALQSTPGLNQNLNNSLSSGMKVKVFPSHRAGVIMSGNPLYVAMPELPDMDPFKTVTTMDSESGASIRHYWGSTLGENTRRYIWDIIWGSTLVAENSARILYPL